MDHPDLNVSNFMEKSIGLKRVERTWGTYESAPDILVLISNMREENANASSECSGKTAQMCSLA